MQTIKDNYRLGDDIQSKVLAFAFGLSAEIERNLISMRTKEALARLKAIGKHLGRPKGSKSRIETNPCYEYREKIVKWQKDGRSKRWIADRIGCGRNTLNRFLITMEEQDGNGQEQ